MRLLLAAIVAAPPLGATASLTPATVSYGDPVTAVVEVRYDPKAVDGSSIRVTPAFAPYVLTAKPVESRESGRLTIRYSLLCVSEGCLPVKASKLVRFRPVTVTAAGRSAAAAWPPLRVESRLHASDLRGEPPFRSPDGPPPPAYRIAPGTLAALAIAAAVLCALGALAVALGRRRRRPAERRTSARELAIAYVRDSAGRPDPDRRRALELLAEAVDDEPGLALAAADAAWSRRPPTSGGAGELADRAEGRT